MRGMRCQIIENTINRHLIRFALLSTFSSRRRLFYAKPQFIQYIIVLDNFFTVCYYIECGFGHFCTKANAERFLICMAGETMAQITSRKNSEIQRLKRLLDDGSFRRSEGLFICHGEVMLNEALVCNMTIECVYCTENMLSAVPAHLKTVTVTPEIIEVISGVGTSVGLVFTCALPVAKEFSGKRFIVLEDVRDPGNVGTIIRTADGLGIDGVIFVGNCADCFAPKVVRSTMGSIFRMPLHFCDTEKLKSLCREHNIDIIAAQLSKSAQVLGKDALNAPCCVMIGNEAHGLSEQAVEIANRSMIIPMKGAESLNAAVAAAIFMWEMRER